jgi:hypothetical protein
VRYRPDRVDRPVRVKYPSRRSRQISFPSTLSGRIRKLTYTDLLSGNCIAARNIAGFAIRQSILESKYAAFGNFTLRYLFCLFSFFKRQLGDAIPAKPIANWLMFRAELQIRLNGANLPLVGSSTMFSDGDGITNAAEHTVLTMTAEL